MKSLKRILPLLILSMIMAAVYISCSKDDLPNNGDPRIRYVRITDPLAADSLLAGAFQGNLIAVIGENLQDAREMWFNDQPAVLTPTYITSTSILVSVPSIIPQDITNTIRIVFANGKDLVYTFKVEINEPVVSSMDCEYVFEGATATIRGNYFYEPVVVTFAGGKVAQNVSVTDQILQVTVPAGALPGPIVVHTNFGTTSSDFWFKDNRNIFLSSDPFTGWWNSNFVVTAPGPNDPPSINGNYFRIKQGIGAWQWLEAAGGPPDAMGPISKNIPDEAIDKPGDYNLKFEVNTKKPYSSNMIKLTVGLAGGFNNDQYLWQPPYDTKGVWQTVVIPYEELAAAYKSSGSALTVNPDGYYTRVLFHGPGDLDADISFDNFRIVPKVLKK